VVATAQPASDAAVPGRRPRSSAVRFAGLGRYAPRTRIEPPAEPTADRSPDRCAEIAALSVEAVTVAAAPVLYARATGIECRKGAIRMSNGCAPS